MGWTGTHRNHGQSLLEFFKEEFEGPRHEILDLATVNRNTCYILMRHKAYNHFGFHYPEYLFCAVVLLKFAPKAYYNIYYKDLDESVGPCESECPERILKAIAPYPPSNKWAWDWRQRCWNNIKRRQSRPKFQIGDVLEFKHSMTFTDGVERNKFTVRKTKPLRFADSTGYWVRLNQRTLNDPTQYNYIPVQKTA